MIGNLQTYKLGIARVGKGSKSKNMALKVKNDDNDKSSKNEDTKFKSYITKQFKKFIKNANVKASDKDHKQSGFSQFNSQDKGKQMSRIWTHEAKCPIYLKSIGTSKALATTLSDTKLKANSDDSDQDGIVSAFTATVEVLREVVELIDEEEELMESKFEKMDERDDIYTAYFMLYKVSEKHEKLYRLATRKLSEVELE